MDGVSVLHTPGVPRVAAVPRVAGSTAKRVMRRPYKSMKHDKLISKRVELQAKLDVLRTRVDTWSCKVDKYNFELDTREVEEAADDTSTVEEAADDTSPVEETSV